MRQGYTPSQSANKAINRIKKFYPEFFGAIVAVTRSGKYGAACSGMAEFDYSVNNGPLNSNSKTFVAKIRCDMPEMWILVNILLYV